MSAMEWLIFCCIMSASLSTLPEIPREEYFQIQRPKRYAQSASGGSTSSPATVNSISAKLSNDGTSSTPSTSGSSSGKFGDKINPKSGTGGSGSPGTTRSLSTVIPPTQSNLASNRFNEILSSSSVNVANQPQIRLFQSVLRELQAPNSNLFGGGSTVRVGTGKIPNSQSQNPSGKTNQGNILSRKGSNFNEPSFFLFARNSTSASGPELFIIRFDMPRTVAASNQNLQVNSLVLECLEPVMNPNSVTPLLPSCPVMKLNQQEMRKLIENTPSNPFSSTLDLFPQFLDNSLNHRQGNIGNSSFVSGYIFKTLQPFLFNILDNIFSKFASTHNPIIKSKQKLGGSEISPNELAHAASQILEVFSPFSSSHSSIIPGRLKYALSPQSLAVLRLIEASNKSHNSTMTNSFGSTLLKLIDTSISNIIEHYQILNKIPNHYSNLNEKIQESKLYVDIPVYKHHSHHHALPLSKSVTHLTSSNAHSHIPNYFHTHDPDPEKLNHRVSQHKSFMGDYNHMSYRPDASHFGLSHNHNSLHKGKGFSHSYHRSTNYQNPKIDYRSYPRTGYNYERSGFNKGHFSTSSYDAGSIDSVYFPPVYIPKKSSHSNLHSNNYRRHSIVSTKKSYDGGTWKPLHTIHRRNFQVSDHLKKSSTGEKVEIKAKGYYFKPVFKPSQRLSDTHVYKAEGKRIF